MGAIWSGAITFGLVNVPVKLYSATEDHDVDLHQVHDTDGGRMRYQRRCEACGEVVPYEHIDRAKAMQVSSALVKSFSNDFEPEQFRDEYQGQLRQLIEAKRGEGDTLDIEETFVGSEEGPGAEVIDLMEALKQSVQRSRASKKASQKRSARAAPKAASKAAPKAKRRRKCA